QCRRRAALKRGGGKADVELHSTILLPGAGEVDTLGIHDAIAALAEHDRTLAELVEARVFGELSIPECAKLFDMAPRTVNRRWAFAIAWLRDRMQ
ncbi:MAG: RNA polymerase subunit sigma, partial [Planctomycetes bacterium]|nr:RNA polymerase subunit sigma [Planctomycetota bacterium]